MGDLISRISRINKILGALFLFIFLFLMHQEMVPFTVPHTISINTKPIDYLSYCFYYLSFIRSEIWNTIEILFNNLPVNRLTHLILFYDGI